MGLFTFAGAVAYVFAILYAKGWLVSASFTNAVALVAAGLLLSLLAGLGQAMVALKKAPDA